jgi:SAM-dependent methyltransferase
MGLIDRIHEAYVFDRRVRTLAARLTSLLPPNASVLDVGCGDGSLAGRIMRARPDIDLRGIDLLVRPKTWIPIDPFDGMTVPFPDDSFDVVMFVDVLHHTHDPMVLLREAARVARKAIVIKDHTADGFLAHWTLRFMDRIGNARHGVALPFNYWPRRKWLDAFEELHLRVGTWTSRVNLYPSPAKWIFERSLHFLVRLDLE